MALRPLEISVSRPVRNSAIIRLLERTHGDARVVVWQMSMTMIAGAAAEVNPYNTQSHRLNLNSTDRSNNC